MADNTNTSTADNSENRPMSLEAQVSAVMAKVDMLVGEMRDKDNHRAAEIAEMRQAFQNMQNSIASMQNQNIFVIIGVVAIAVAVFLK